MITSTAEAYLSCGFFEIRDLFAHYFHKLIAYLILFLKIAFILI